MPDVSRRALLRGFLALPVAARFAPGVVAQQLADGAALASKAPVVEAARNIFVRDLGLWFASFPEMYRAFNWDFRGHTVEVREGYPCNWTDMQGKPDGVMGYVMNCKFTQLGPPPEPIKVHWTEPGPLFFDVWSLHA